MTGECGWSIHVFSICGDAGNNGCPWQLCFSDSQVLSHYITSFYVFRIMNFYNYLWLQN